MVKVFFIQPDGKTIIEAKGAVGDSLLDVAQAHDIDLEGACESSMACSTCHLVIDAKDFKKLPQACEEEEDMLDLTFGLRPTSRLGCQVILTKELDGIRVHVPAETRNMLL
jgi:ferredoxin